MPLSELKKKLYQKDGLKREREKTVYDPASTQKNEADKYKVSPWQIKEKKSPLDPSVRRPLLWIVGGVSAVLIFIASAAAFVSIRAGMFDSSRVAIDIVGPQKVLSGQEVTYVIKYRNDNRVKLEDAHLVLSYSPQFHLISPEEFIVEKMGEAVLPLGQIGPRTEKELVVKGVFTGEQNATMFLAAMLNFKPVARQAPMQVEKRIGVYLESPPIGLTVEGMQEVFSGAVAEYIIKYENTGTENLSKVRLLADFPEGFKFSGSAPLESSDGRVWEIGDLPAGGKGTLRIWGVLESKPDTVARAFFRIGSATNDASPGSFARGEWTTYVTRPILQIKQRVSGLTDSQVASPGSVLRYVLSFSNQGDIGLRDVVLRLSFRDSTVDFSRLNLRGKGFFDSQTKTIVWRAADHPALKTFNPGQEGEISFTVPIKDKFDIRSEEDKNFTVTTVAYIDSPDVPTPLGQNKTIASDTLTLKISSPVDFKTEIFYDDFRIRNTGPLPPRVGKQTTYTIRWTVANGTNELTDARVESYLPSGVDWTNKIYPSDEKITFNPRTNRVVWEIGDVPNGTGYFLPKREVRFQVAIRPSIEQVGSRINLLKKSVFKALDTFTGLEVVRTERPRANRPDDKKDFSNIDMVVP